jgi:iron(III) transport system substrate-binding protein
MKRQWLRGMVVAALAPFVSIGYAVFAGPVDDLVAATKKEGTFELYAPSTLTPQGSQALAEAFNKKYGLGIKVQYNPSGNMTKDIAKIIGLAASGIAPEWDLMVVTDAHHASLWLRKQHQPFDYAKLGVDPKAVHYDNGSVSFANQFALPAYNSKVLPAKDVPRNWEDLLDPKWKGGKLGIATALHHLGRLAAGAWGEERTTRFVKGLAGQGLTLGRLGELQSRLLLGEILIAVTLTDDFTNSPKRSAPIFHAEAVQPVVSPAYHAGVPKGALHPNAAHLFAAFLTSKEAQEIWERFTDLSSAFVPGTAAHKYAQGKQVIFMNQNQANEVERLANAFGKILGFGQ